MNDQKHRIPLPPFLLIQIYRSFTSQRCLKTQTHNTPKLSISQVSCLDNTVLTLLCRRLTSSVSSFEINFASNLPHISQGTRYCGSGVHATVLGEAREPFSYLSLTFWITQQKRRRYNDFENIVYIQNDNSRQKYWGQV